MTSRRSFLADLRENWKRRTWIFWLQVLVLFCYFPGFLFIYLNRASNVVVYQGTELAAARTRMLINVVGLFDVNIMGGILVMGLAMAAGLQSFSYLHSRQQVNFYHSQPVSRNRRFLVIWLNGIISFLLAYVINALLGLLTANIFGAMDPSVITAFFRGIFIYLLLYVCVYHLGIIAVMLTGNVLVSICAFAVLAGFEVAVRAIAALFCGTFFYTYSDMSVTGVFETRLSPVVSFFYWIYNDSVKVAVSRHPQLWYLALTLALQALIFGLAGWLLYLKRKSESHGQSLSYPQIREPLKVVLLLAEGSFFGLMIFFVSGGESLAMGIVGGVFFTLLGHAVIEMIYEVDLSAVKHHLVSLVISLAGVILIFLGFKYDWFGYDRYLPKQDRVESAAVLLHTQQEDYRVLLEDGDWVWDERYLMKNMAITDLDPVYELAQNALVSDKTDPDWHSVDVAYHLKNGKTIYRRYTIDYTACMDTLDKLYHAEEYQNMAYQYMKEDFLSIYQISEMYYNTGFEQETITGGGEELMAAYRQDISENSLSDIHWGKPVGAIELSGNKNEWQIPVYENFTHTAAVLAAQQISILPDYQYIAENIEQISVDYVNGDAYADSGYAGSQRDYTVRLTYHDTDDIEKLLEETISDELYTSHTLYDGWSVEIQWKAGNTLTGENYSERYFVNEVPQELLERVQKADFGTTVIN